jgi:hypothetical protein
MEGPEKLSHRRQMREQVLLYCLNQINFMNIDFVHPLLPLSRLQHMEFQNELELVIPFPCCLDRTLVILRQRHLRQIILNVKEKRENEEDVKKNAQKT